jgi:WD40 repeat protein
LSRFHRAPGDECLTPDTFVRSFPTGKLGAMCVAFSPDGLLLAAGCANDVDFPVRIYDVDGGQEVASLRGHGNLIYSVSWSADSQWLVSTSGDGKGFVWHVPHATVAASAAYAPHHHVYDKIPQLPHSVLLHSPPSYVYSARFHPLAPSLIITGAYDKGVRLWDAHLYPDAATAAAAAGVIADTRSAAAGGADVDGTLLGYIGGSPIDHAAQRTPGGLHLGTPLAGGGGAPGAVTSVHHGGYVNVVEFDGEFSRPAPGVAGGGGHTCRRLLTADSVGTILIWSVRSDAPHRPDAYALLREMRPAIFRGVPIVSVRVRPGRASDHILVVGHSNLVRLFDLNTFVPLRGFPSARCVSSRIDACFSPDGRYIASGSEDGALTLWDVETSAVIRAQARVGSGRLTDVAFPSAMFGVAWHPSQHLIAVSAFGNFPVMLVGARGVAAAARSAAPHPPPEQPGTTLATLPSPAAAAPPLVASPTPVAPHTQATPSAIPFPVSPAGR